MRTYIGYSGKSEITKIEANMVERFWCGIKVIPLKIQWEE